MALFRRRIPAAPQPDQVGPPTVVDDDRCLPAVGTSWMIAPTLRETGTQTSLRGTSCYQDIIAPLAWAVWDATPPTDLATVQLAVVPAGQWAGAVGVYAAGRRVASIAADAAEEYRGVMATLAAAGLPAIARAVVLGGHPRGARGREARRFGLALIEPSHPGPADADQPFLPPGMGVEATVPDHVAAALDAAFPSRAKNHVRRTTGHVEPADGILVVDGQVIGQLFAHRPGDVDLVRAAADAGHPTTCLVRMIRAPERRLRVTADLPWCSNGPTTSLVFDLL